MGFPVNKAYILPINAKSLVGTVMANLCESDCPLHMSAVVVSSQRVVIDKAFLVPKCVRLARLSYYLHQLLRKMLGAVPEPKVEDLSAIWQKSS